MTSRHALILAGAAAAAAGLAYAHRPDEGQTYPGGTPVDPEDRPDIPDRVSIEQDSPFYFAMYPMLNVQINGKDSQQVVEYCKSEGWARLCQRDSRGRMRRDQKGRPITVTVSGQIRPYWRDQPIPNVAVVFPAEQVARVSHETEFVRPAMSREEARRKRQREAKERKDAARRS